MISNKKPSSNPQSHFGVATLIRAPLGTFYFMLRIRKKSPNLDPGKRRQNNIHKSQGNNFCVCYFVHRRFVRISRNKTLVLLLIATQQKIPFRGFSYLCAVVEEVRTIFVRRNDTTIYIPSFYPTPEITTSISSVAF